SGTLYQAMPSGGKPRPGAKPSSGHDQVVFSVEVAFSANRTENTTSTENSTSRFYALPQSPHQSQLIMPMLPLCRTNPAAQLRQIARTRQSATQAAPPSPERLVSRARH